MSLKDKIPAFSLTPPTDYRTTIAPTSDGTEPAKKKIPTVFGASPLEIHNTNNVFGIANSNDTIKGASHLY